MSKLKKILSLEDLEKFYESHKRSTHFSSKESGYQLAVHVPAQFEIAEELGDDTVLFAKARVFHLGVNRNKSSVTKEAAEKAMKTMAYKPVLAGFTDVNGELDFTAHDMELDEENDRIIYLEKQIGCITADEPWFEEDEELGKTYVCAYVAIPREYTPSASIIERKNGTKVSVELLINEMNFSGKDKCLELTDVIVQGLTALGTNPENGKPVEEGMYGSKITLKDFSKSNNSVFSSIDEEDKEKLIEMRETINNMLSRFDINKQVNEAEENSKKGGNVIDMENEEIKVVEEVTETDEVEAIVIEEEAEVEANEADVTETESTDEVTETVTENESEETVDESTPKVVETSEEDDEVTETEVCKKKKCEEESVDEPEEVEETVETEVCKKKKCEEDTLFNKTFELSHDDIRCALYTLLSSYESVNNDWYWITSIYDNYFVYQGMMGEYHGQKYVKNEDDTVAFDGEPYNLYAEFLTESEKATLNEMRSNYSLATEKLAAYEKAELDAQKEEVLADANYAEFAETESFKEIRENIEKYSLDELKTAAELAFAKEVKAKGTFALHEEEKPKTQMFAFSKIETKSSFLDGLLGK